MQRDFKGIWIPKEIWLNKELKVMEKLFLVEIDSLDNENGCFASNDYFSEFFGLSKNRCSEIIKSLEKKGLITISYKYKEGTKAIDKRILKVFEKSNICIRKIDKMYSENRPGYSEKCEDNNTINNTINNNKKNKKETEFDVLINSYTSNPELKETLYEFIKMRKTIKEPMTTRALKIMLNKLSSLADNDIKKINIINNSIFNNWKGIFDFKDEYKKNVNETKDNNLGAAYQDFKF